MRSRSGPGLSNRTVQQCEICEQFEDPEALARELDEIALFGAAKYGWCVGCGREVPRPWSEDYKAPWDERAAERQWNT